VLNSFGSHGFCSNYLITFSRSLCPDRESIKAAMTNIPCAAGFVQIMPSGKSDTSHCPTKTLPPFCRFQSMNAPPLASPD
jgi:hypothetical protein